MKNIFQVFPRFNLGVNQTNNSNWAKTFLVVPQLFATSVLATSATLIAIALPASTFAAYVPPTDQVPSRSRGGTAGRRSPCEITQQLVKPTIKPTQLSQSSNLGLAALAPVSYMGKTGSIRPTLAWYNDYCGAVPVQLSVYEYDLSNSRLNQQPIFSQRLTAKPGISTFSLPGDAIALTTGKTYAWQVVVEADSPAKSPWFRIPLLVGTPTAQLQSQLQNSTNIAQKIDAYAQAGFWYDALALALSADQPNKSAMFGLLKQLSALEQSKEPSQQPLSRRFSHTLNRIVELEKANKFSGGTHPETNRLSQK